MVNPSLVRDDVTGENRHAQAVSPRFSAGSASCRTCTTEPFTAPALLIADLTSSPKTRTTANGPRNPARVRTYD